jgi:hypothetical protein
MKTLIAAAVLLVGGWTANASDNVCGIKDVDKVSNPATIQWAIVLKETPEMKRIVKERIKKTSPEGRVLLAEARSRVTRWTNVVMKEHKYGSVWKKIEHPNKKAKDVSRYVIAKMLAK